MKDSKGHGSNSRGRSYLGAFDPRYADAAARFASLSPADRAAQTELARGSAKSETPPVHGGSAGRLVMGNTSQYSREAVNNAIASSNRAGRHIGGREARMIHSLLKGRG